MCVCVEWHVHSIFVYCCQYDDKLFENYRFLFLIRLSKFVSVVVLHFVFVIGLHSTACAVL